MRKTTAEYTTYRLDKFTRSNQGTSINQRAVVTRSDRGWGQVLRGRTRPPIMGELALGKNLLVAFMSWEGHNYEDAIILSQRLVQDDVLSQHPHRRARRSMPATPSSDRRKSLETSRTVSEEVLADLDERGIIRIGADVVPGDILVGKVTPKGETELTPEERLLRAIFGEKAREVRDTSSRCRTVSPGKIIGVRVFDTDERRRAAAGREPPRAGLHRAKAQDHRRRQTRWPSRQQGCHRQDPSRRRHAVHERRNAGRHRAEPARCARPHERRPGSGRRTSVGRPPPDGKSTRPIHGWPSLPEGSPASEPHRVATPVFDGAREEELSHGLRLARVQADGLAPGERQREGQLVRRSIRRAYPGTIAVGYIYILKLLHLVDDKIHARSTGPYSMITQQPLGGKAQFGGQRFGEMEVWALEAYGAAYALQELLTIKSDDVLGRVKLYEAIVKGENIPEPGIPESFKVLVKEMQSLCLNVEVLSSDGVAIEMKDSDDDVFRAAEELGIDLSRREPSSVEEL